MRIKGRYVAQIVIDFDYDPVKCGATAPFEVVRESVVGGGLTEAIREVIYEEVYDERVGTFNVEQIHAELYEVNDDD